MSDVEKKLVDIGLVCFLSDGINQSSSSAAVFVFIKCVHTTCTQRVAIMLL
jgi:hypothetical protein